MLPTEFLPWLLVSDSGLFFPGEVVVVLVAVRLGPRLVGAIWQAGWDSGDRRVWWCLCLLGEVVVGGRWLRGSSNLEVEVLGCFWVAVPRLELLWGGCPGAGEGF